MIKNERQYRMAKTRERSLAGQLNAPATSGLRPAAAALPPDVAERLDSLRLQIQDYETLQRNPGMLEIHSIDELPRALIRARIALGLSQRQLALRLGLKDQQIQRYEASEYVGVSIDRIRAICAALGLALRTEMKLPTPSLSLRTLLRKLQRAGISSDFLISRLLPADLARALSKPRLDDHGPIVDQIASLVGRIYNWSTDQILSDAPLVFDDSALATVRYKRAKSQVESPGRQAYVIYAHYIAMLILQCFDRQQRRLEGNPSILSNTLVAPDGRISLTRVLDLVWGSGIPVIPLRDSGAFHGAWWRVGGRDVIIVKQKSSSESRWVIDILHEYHHAITATADSGGIVEDTDTMNSKAVSATEQRATDFAVSVALRGCEDKLMDACVHEARSKVEWLKAAVPRVAQRERVDQGLLANYLAYRLSLQKVNWWPTANHLQPSSPDPFGVCLAHVQKHVSFDSLTPLDRQLTLRAFS